VRRILNALMEIVSSEFVEEPVLMLALSVLLIMIVTRLSIVERMAPVILKFKENALRCTLLIMELLVFRPVFLMNIEIIGDVMIKHAQLEVIVNALAKIVPTLIAPKNL